MSPDLLQGWFPVHYWLWPPKNNKNIIVIVKITQLKYCKYLWFDVHICHTSLPPKWCDLLILLLLFTFTLILLPYLLVPVCIPRSKFCYDLILLVLYGDFFFLLCLVGVLNQISIRSQLYANFSTNDVLPSMDRLGQCKTQIVWQWTLDVNCQYEDSMFISLRNLSTWGGKSLYSKVS